MPKIILIKFTILRITKSVFFIYINNFVKMSVFPPEVKKFYMLSNLNSPKYNYWIPTNSLI